MEECIISYRPKENEITVQILWPTRALETPIITQSIVFSTVELVAMDEAVRRQVVESELTTRHTMVVPKGVINAVLALVGS